jgi:hypothetical protein
MLGQLDLFGSSVATVPSTSILGLSVILPKERACAACGSINATVGSSGGPHYARYLCASCGGFVGWMRGETYAFVCEVVDQFGRPTESISIRMTGRSSYAH